MIALKHFTNPAYYNLKTISDAISTTLNCAAYKNGIWRLNNFSLKQKQGDKVLNASYVAWSYLLSIS
jgi:hypothetical protein